MKVGNELKVFPLSAFMYAHGYSGPGRHICGHISNKPTFENRSAAGGEW